MYPFFYQRRFISSVGGVTGLHVNGYAKLANQGLIAIAAYPLVQGKRLDNAT